MPNPTANHRQGTTGRFTGFWRNPLARNTGLFPMVLPGLRIDGGYPVGVRDFVFGTFAPARPINYQGMSAGNGISVGEKIR